MSLTGALLGNQPLWCFGLGRLLADQGWRVDLELVTSVGEVLKRLGEGEFDLLVLDLYYLEPSGPPDLAPLFDLSPRMRVVALDERPNRSALEHARAQGMNGYITKTTPPHLLAAQLGVVLAGGAYFPNSLPFEGESGEEDWSRSLSPRRRQVLHLVRQGLSNQKIAAELGITVATVKLHVHALLRASGARSRTALAVLGLSHVSQHRS